MGYTVLIPARLASTRLPNKPLADLWGAPMVVRVAQRVRSGVAPSTRIVVAADHASILQACKVHGVESVLTRQDHPSGSDRLAEACDVLGLSDSEIVVNVQGDEPLIDTHLVQAVAQLLTTDTDASTRLRIAAEEFDTATITTIHGFCQQVLTTLGVNVPLDPALKLLADEETLITQIAADLLAGQALAESTAEGTLPKLAKLTEAIRMG